MGIYPNVAYTRRGDELTVVTDTPGLKVVETFVLAGKTETRDDCYCCSCGEREGSDPFCRNHGFAGKRKCETHCMPGDDYVVDYDTGIPTSEPMLSVQAERARMDRVRESVYGS